MSRLYLVDDHVMIREGLRAVLEVSGHEVVGETADPTLALADILRLSPDVLLLDLALGDHSGFELLSEVQRRALPVRCMIFTMSVQPHHVAEALRFGAAGYLLKDAPTQELLGAIDAVLQGRRHFGPQVADLAVRALSNEAGAVPVATLSTRERQIILMVVRGQSSAAIGAQLHLSPKTVDTYRSRLMGKLGVADLPGLVRWAIRTGLIDASE